MTSFSRLSIHALAAKIQPDKVVRWCRNGDFLRAVFAARRMQHISDMHSKSALFEKPSHFAPNLRDKKLNKHAIFNAPLMKLLLMDI